MTKKNHEERLREIITSFWESTKPMTKSNLVRNHFLSFMAKEGMTRNTTYRHFSEGCIHLTGYKLMGVYICVMKFKKLSKDIKITKRTYNLCRK